MYIDDYSGYSGNNVDINDFEFTKEALRKITNELLDEWRKKDE